MCSGPFRVALFSFDVEGCALLLYLKVLCVPLAFTFVQMILFTCVLPNYANQQVYVFLFLFAFDLTCTGCAKRVFIFWIRVHSPKIHGSLSSALAA